MAGNSIELFNAEHVGEGCRDMANPSRVKRNPPEVLFMMRQVIFFLSALLPFVLCQSAFAAVAGDPGDELGIAKNGKANAVVVVSANAGKLEKKGAEDLARYIGLMCGDAPKIVGKIPSDDTPALVMGRAALDAMPRLKGRIAAKLKKNPYLRSDGIAVVREGARVYIAGNHDPAHYYAVAELLSRWGCRWYVPRAFCSCERSSFS